MSALKDQDPDYGPSVASNEKHQRIYEENARSSTTRKITAIVEKEFSQEIANKEREVLEIQERLHKALKTLHLLRYVVVADFYGRKQCHNNQAGEAKQTQIHPAIKQLIGKYPKALDTTSVPSTSSRDNTHQSIESHFLETAIKQEKEEIKEHNVPEKSQDKVNEDEEPRPRKIPRYVPPKSRACDSPDPSRNARHKIRKRIIVGNISKWIPPDWREDAASHKWTMYVRGNKENPDIDDFVAKVRFFLHPSYRPNDVVEVTSAPFCLSRRGWGEFPVRVQLHFKSALDKPMDIIHHLKLDRTYTGLQTLGSETLVDIWIYADSKPTKRSVSKDENHLEKEENMKSHVEGSLIKHEDDVIVQPKLESEDCTFLASTNSSERSEIRTVSFDRAMQVANQQNRGSPKCISIKKEFNLENHLESKVNSTLQSQILPSTGKGNNLSPQAEVHIKIEPADASFEVDIKSENVLPSLPVALCKRKLQQKNNCQFIDIERLRTLINLDHDYLAGKQQQAFQEENLTIDHTIGKSSSNSIALKSSFVNTGMSISTQATKNFTGSIVLPSNNLRHKLNSTNNRIPATLPLQLQESALQPLKISIPPLFEPKANKRVLVLQDDKTIPVDIASGRSSTTSLLPGSKVRLNFPVARGLSLLKKSVNVKSVSKSAAESETGRLNEPLVNIPNLKVNPAGSMLLNMNCNVPTLKIAEVKPTVYKEMAGCSSNHNEIPNSKPDGAQDIVVRNKITLGKDKHKIQTRKDIYEKNLRTIETAKITDTLSLISFIARRLPIITPHASDPDYRRMHPYACKSEDEFFACSIPKRRALEWNRALMIRDFVNRKIVAEEDRWTTKEILTWARLHGYTPVCSTFTFNIQCDGTKRAPDTESVNEEFSTSTEPTAFNKWLSNCPKKSQANGLSSRTDQNDDQSIIDVETLDLTEFSKGLKKRSILNNMEHTKDSSKVNVLELNKAVVPLCEFVSETAHQIGIKLVPEEIVPGVAYCAASRVIAKAVECLVDDLVRGALAKAWENHDGTGYPKEVTLNDVRRALLNREEFDIFTNEGLGSNYRSMLMD